MKAEAINVGVRHNKKGIICCLFIVILLVLLLVGLAYIGGLSKPKQEKKTKNDNNKTFLITGALIAIGIIFIGWYFWKLINKPDEKIAIKQHAPPKKIRLP